MENKIYSAICNVMSDLGAIGKDSKNAQQGFMYRGVDAVMNALNPLLCKHNIFVVPNTLSQTREERTTKGGSNMIYSICTVEYTFYADDGSNIKTVVIGEGMDSGDKATNKALSIAFKYACCQVFCIATEETHPDADAEIPESSMPKKTTAPVDKGVEKSAPISSSLICVECGTEITKPKSVDFYKRHPNIKVTCFNCGKR